MPHEDHDERRVHLWAGREIGDPDIVRLRLRLGRIDDLAVEHGSISPHSDLAGLEQRHDVFPRHRRHALGTVVAQQLAVEADGVDRGFGIKYGTPLSR
jgi:hypothetical protein